MKKILSIGALALMSVVAVNAKTVDQLRVYINPGHGSWCSNDRPLKVHYMKADGTVGTKDPNTKSNSELHTPDTTAFYETNTNLRKCFGIMEKLIDFGVKFDRTLNQTNDRWRVGAAKDLSNNIVFSHVKVGPYPTEPTQKFYYNRNLSEIAKEVEDNNFDIFISVHSNATNSDNSTTNYPVFMYRGYDDTSKTLDGLTSEYQVLCKNIAKAAWTYAIENPHSVWSNTNPVNGVRGDINYMGSYSTVNGYTGYLGVLKHGVPGYLSEGYFHTYQPARHRAMNWDVDAVEGYAYARGVADYFNIKKDGTGWIYGQLRDLHERFTAAYYNPNVTSVDKFLAINGATVKLKKDGKELETYTTDNFYNGAFVFKNLAPGTYTVEVSHPDYKAIDPITVVVKADAVAYPDAIQMERTDYVETGEKFETYPDPVGADNPEYSAPTAVDFTQTYVDEPIAELEGKTVRRIIARKDRMYILAVDADKAPTVLVYNTEKKEVEANVSTTGIQGSEYILSDIALTDDNVLLGSPKQRNQYSDDYLTDGGVTYERGTWRLYRWENDATTGLPTGNPKQLYSTKGSGMWFRAFLGHTITATGTLDEGTVVTTAETTGASGQVRAIAMPMTEGKISSESNHKIAVKGNGSSSGATYPYPRDLGREYRLYISPNDNNNMILTFSNDDAPAYVYNLRHGDYVGALETLSAPAAKAGSLGFFRYAGHSYMSVNSVEEGNNVGSTLVDVTDGYASPKAVVTNNAKVDAVATTFPHSAATSNGVYDPETSKLTDAYINMFTLRDGKLTKVTTKVEPAEPVTEATRYAYDLKAVKSPDNIDTYLITFKSTGDAPNAAIIITPAEGGDEINMPIGAVTAGENTFTLPLDELTEGVAYNWAIAIQSESCTSPGKVFSYKTTDTAVRGGVVNISEPAYDSFGYTVVGTGKAGGFDVFTPELEHVGSFLKGDKRFASGNQSSPFRGDQLEGKAVFADWSDAGSGYWVIDPLAPQDTYDMMGGTKDSKGAHIVDGSSIGGGSTCVAFQNAGTDNLKMYSFVEDYPAGNTTGGQNYVYRYDLGAERTIMRAPDFKTIYSGSKYLNNQNVEIVAVNDGIFISQCRGAGNNEETVPNFLFADNNGDMKYNSSALTQGHEKGCSSGIAITRDLTTFAMASYSTGISIFNVDWTDGVPTMQYLYEIPTSESSIWTHMQFDYAGNLHVYNRDSKGYYVYAPRTKNPVVTTPANSFIQREPTGVENVDVDAVDTDAPAVYYNLNGVMMPADRLAPGVYIKVVGDKAQKVIVK